MGGVVGGAEGEPGWFGIVVVSPGCGVALVGGVIGMLEGDVDEDGFTEVSAPVDDDELIEESPVAPVVIVPPLERTVAEVSVDIPVLAEPAHQSRLARVFGEAFK